MAKIQAAIVLAKVQKSIKAKEHPKPARHIKLTPASSIKARPRPR